MVYQLEAVPEFISLVSQPFFFLWVWTAFSLFLFTKTPILFFSEFSDLKSSTWIIDFIDIHIKNTKGSQKSSQAIENLYFKYYLASLIAYLMAKSCYLGLI